MISKHHYIVGWLVLIYSYIMFGYVWPELFSAPSDFLVSLGFLSMAATLFTAGYITIHWTEKNNESK